MTYQEFLQRLRETPRDWKITPLGRIRHPGSNGPCDRHCPLSLVFGGPLYDADITARKNGMDIIMADKIIASADYRPQDAMDCYFDPQIRRELLEACGIKEAE